MRALIGWLAAFLAGSAGWWLGSKVGFGTAVMLGVVASGWACTPGTGGSTGT